MSQWGGRLDYDRGTACIRQLVYTKRTRHLNVIEKNIPRSLPRPARQRPSSRPSATTTRPPIQNLVTRSGGRASETFSSYSGSRPRRYVAVFSRFPYVFVVRLSSHARKRPVKSFCEITRALRSWEYKTINSSPSFLRFIFIVLYAPCSSVVDRRRRRLGVLFA